MGDAFERLVADAASAPIQGWDFSWLDGRATEERPSWHYFDRVIAHATRARRLLDVQTGAGNLIADLPRLPPLTVATEGFEPNVGIAGRRVRTRGAHLVRTDEARPALPFAGEAFDLVVSRHPVDTWWDEIARVLAPGGCYVSQQVGPDSLRDLREFLMGPQPAGSKRDPQVARRAATRAGLVVEELRVERPRVTFSDIGAVVYLLRLVVWTVPDFTVDRYRDRLRALHHHIEREGSFDTTSSRFLIEARKP